MIFLFLSTILTKFYVILFSFLFYLYRNMDKNRLISNANNYFYLNFKFLFLNLKLKYFLIMHVSLGSTLSFGVYNK